MVSSKPKSHIMTTQSSNKPFLLLKACWNYTFLFFVKKNNKFFSLCTDFAYLMQARMFKGRSVSFLFPPAMYFPRWSDRGSTDPSISGCLDSLPPVHHGADPRPPSRSLHLSSGCCRCCSPPRPGEGPTGVFLFSSIFPLLVSFSTHLAPTI